MKRFLLVGALIGALLAPAVAQVNTVSQTGLTTAYLPRQTYSAAFFGLVPAASATDVICLSGSATKTIRLQNIHLSGTAGTLVTTPIQLLRRVSVDTGGTPASTTANPANTIAKRDVNNGTATAVPVSYTANPTIVDATPTYIESASITLNLSGTSTGMVTQPPFDFAKDTENFLQAPALSGVAAQFCLNFGAVSISSGVLNGSITWTEE